MAGAMVEESQIEIGVKVEEFHFVGYILENMGNDVHDPFQLS